MINYFETHCHLDFPDYKNDRDEVIKNSTATGVKYFINVGIDTDTIKRSISLTEKYPAFYAACGYHPNYADRFDKKLLRDHIAHPKVVAIGEIGLDYYRNYTCKELQKEVFASQLQIAVDNNLPVIIHNREANNDCWQILAEFKPEKAVFHCFAGDIALAEKIWEQGWLISVTANVTYKNCKIIDIIKECPADRIMSETDCPFLAPQHIRGKRNDPSYLPLVVERIAQIKELPVNLTAELLYSNAYDFFLKKT